MSERAEKCDLSAEVLSATIARYNICAAGGEDDEFHKGESAYNRSMGDLTHRPNPCLAPIETPPFYAVRIFTGNLGTSRGLRTDGNARALTGQGQPIEGLYAVGNEDRKRTSLNSSS